MISFGLPCQLCTEVTSLGSELSLARGVSQQNEAALEEVGRSRAELARDKASLVVQLTASERENSALTEELSTYRRVSKAGESFLHHRMPFVTSGF